MSLVRLTNEELSAIVASHKLTDNALTVIFANMARLHLDDAFPEVQMAFYASPSLQNPLFLFTRVRNPFSRHYANVTVTRTDFQKTDFERIVEEFISVENLSTPPDDGLVLVGPDACTTIIQSIAARLWPQEVDLLPHPCWHYWMSKDQMERVREDKGPDLGEDYVDDDVPDPERYAKEVMATWRHAQGEKEIALCKAKLRRLPSVIVFPKADRTRPIGCVLTDFLGEMTHQFVEEAHRRRGIGNRVEWGLARKMIDRRLVPVKSVEDWNLNVISATERSPVWSTLSDVDGRPLPFCYLDVRQRTVATILEDVERGAERRA